MKPLWPGDRVRLRGYSCVGHDVDGKVGEYLETDDDGDAVVSLDDDLQVCVKLSQIKSLLVPKKRLRWWLLVNIDSTGHVKEIVEASGCFAKEDPARVRGNLPPTGYCWVHVTESKRESGGKEK
jgi:hypothetical protein